MQVTPGNGSQNIDMMCFAPCPGNLPEQVFQYKQQARLKQAVLYVTSAGLQHPQLQEPPDADLHFYAGHAIF